MSRILLIVFVLNLLNTVENFNVDILTTNFFKNLQADPKLLADHDFGANSRNFIDKQIENYVNLITNKPQINRRSIKTKRSLTEKLLENFSGTSVLNKIEPFATIPSKFSEDIALFNQNNQSYLATLESRNIKEPANQLKIYRIIDNSFESLIELPVENARKITTFPLNNTTLIIVVENHTITENFHAKSGLYQFDNLKQLKKIQSFNLTNCSDIEFWKIHEDLYLGITYFSQYHQYEVDMLIYKWLDGYFDVMQTIPTKNPKKIKPFRINNSYYLAIANNRDNNGKTNIYSEIYKFNHHRNKYELYQRISTKACNDIEFFTINREYFLIIANLYEETDTGIDYETDSIVYKFVDNHFIPFQSFQLNGLENWLPITNHNTIALIATTRYEGLKFYQYDGWMFIEIVPKLQQIPKKSIKTLHYYPDYNQTLIITQKIDQSLMYQVKFSHQDPVKEIHDNMLDWCRNSNNLIANLQNDQILTKRGDITIDEDIDKIETKIDSITATVEKIDRSLQTTLQSTTDKEIGRKLISNRLIFNTDVFIDNLNTNEINHKRIDQILTKSYDINEDFVISNCTFESLSSDAIIIENINEKSAKSLIYRNETLIVDQLRVDRITSDNLKVILINGVEVNDQNLLLNHDQYFEKFVQLEFCTINELKTDTINNFNLSTLTIDNKVERVVVIENLTVDSLIIGGLINNVDITTLDKYSLKLHGNQLINESYIFKNLSSFNLITNTINGKHLNNLINIDSGTFNIGNELIFTKNLTINRLEILEYLNNIKIISNQIDGLFRNISDKQTIKAKKIFKDLQILNPIDLRGKINCEKCKTTNPVITIDQDLFITNTSVINSQITIEELLKTNDIRTYNRRYSLQKVKDFGLRLDQKEINVVLNFSQQLNVDEIFLERINNFHLNDMIMNGGNEVQIIRDLKICNGDLYIDGFSEIFNINNIDLDEFDRNVLRQNGDQIIDGKHHVKHVITESISSNDTKFGETPWDKIINLTTNHNTTETLTIKGPITTESLTINHLLINGLINNYNFTKLINDTVRKSNNSTIKGYKSFRNLTIDNLIIDNFNLIDIDRIYNETNGQVSIEKSVTFHQPVRIENINFNNEINKITKNEFERIDENQSETQIIPHKLNLSHLIILGEGFVENSRINSVDFRDLLENTIKTHEDHYFETATFDTIISEQFVKINGEIERVDLDNIIFNSHFEQIVYDRINFTNNLTINGTINFENHVNNFNLSEFCDFTMGQIEYPKNLIINNGNVYFVKGPNIKTINNFNVNELWENAWFANRDTLLNGSAAFKKIVFDDDVVVEGFVGDIDLLELSKNYFSKSKDQIFTGNFDISNTIDFKSNLTITKKLLQNGEINGINLDKLINNILIDNYNQTFEDTVYIENCTIANINGEFLLNNYDLRTDLMRYDQTNIVTSLKTIENLFVEHLIIDKEIRLENIEIIGWLKRIVTKSGDFNINSLKRFTNVSITSGLNLLGHLNNLRIDGDHIMVKNQSQDISGRKTFTNIQNRFKAIKLRGLLNNIELDKFVENQALRNRDMVLKSAINFHNSNITTRNLIINKNFQDFNLTQLISDVENLGVINNLLDNYRDLLIAAEKIDNSIQNRAYFLYDYEIIQTLIGYKQSFRLIYTNGTEQIAAVHLKNDLTEIELYEWNDESQQFSAFNYFEYNSTNINYIDQVLMKRYLYIEENFSRCNYAELSNPLVLVEHWMQLTNQTIWTNSFILPTTNQSCTLFIYKFGDISMAIYCETDDEDDDLRLMQNFQIPGAYKSTSIMIENTLVLFIINRAMNSMKSGITIWHLDTQSNVFVLKQKIKEAEPKSLSVITMKNRIFLSIASGHLQDSMYSGKIVIKKYSIRTKRFEYYQNIMINSPKQVEFSLLPTNELILYIVTDNPIQTLLIYRYEGINRFQQKFIGTTLHKIDYLYQLINQDQSHFIVTQNNDEIVILKVILRGGN